MSGAAPLGGKPELHDRPLKRLKLSVSSTSNISASTKTSSSPASISTSTCYRPSSPIPVQPPAIISASSAPQPPILTGTDDAITALPQGHTYGDFNIHNSNAIFGDVNYYASEKPEGKGCLRDADMWIRNNHYTADRLKIERLSGEPLPMDQCYINLAIVEQSSQDGGRSKKGDATHQSSPFSLPARLKVETPDKNEIELPTIFNPRKEPNGQTTHPRRILIRGQAGVGKTTLCKKIVHDFTHHGTWRELFDRLLWVPLRRLKGRRDVRYSLGDLLYDEYFSQHVDGHRLSDALWRALDTQGGKTLFVLDGLDEVSQDLDRDDDMFHFLTHLLNQCSVIITSRPYATLPAGLSALDLELETIGFYPEQVKGYLGKAFTDPKRAGEVLSFLQHHRLIQSLGRIPILLDALCYTWDDYYNSDDPNSGTKLQTMTTVYKAIEQRLWKKDVLRLGKKHSGELVKRGQIQTAGPLKIERLVKDEISFLESLAFTGLHNDVIEFEWKYLDYISDHFTPSLLLDKTLPCLSFLRTSDPLSDNHNRNYHFLHLTFQEYFAAQYFVRCWASHQQLSCLKLKLGSTRGRDMTKIPTETFVQREKYNGRYDIFWRFVAGLLWDYGEELHRFFERIEYEPRDLLGPAHQRLVMHCLNEVALRDGKFLKDLRGKIELRCQQWSVFEYKLLREMHLCGESEFPDKALTKMLAEGSNNERTAILNALMRRSQLSGNVLEKIAALLLEDPDSRVRHSAVWALGGLRPLPDNILQALVSRLEDPDLDVRHSTVQALGRQRPLPDNILQAQVSRLEHPDSSDGYPAVWALGKQPLLPDNILQALVSQLDHPDSPIRHSAVQALGEQRPLPDNILQALVSRLEDPDWRVRLSTVQALGRQRPLPDNILQAQVSRLEHPDPSVSNSAVRALGGLRPLPDNILQALVSRLEHPRWQVRHFAVWALGEHCPLPDNILQALVSRLEDPDPSVSNSAVQALGEQRPLPDNILQALVSRVLSRLEHPDWQVRHSAVQALGGQRLLPDNILQALVSRLEDTDRDVRHSATQALGKQSSLPDTILQALVSRLEDTDRRVRHSATQALGNQSSLPDNILQALVSPLQHTDWDVRHSATQVLGNQSSLPDNILQALVSRLEDTDWDVRDSAIEALDIDRFYSILPSLNTHTLQILYRSWVKRGIVEQFSCYIQDGNLHIETPNRRREIALLHRKDDFLKAFLTEASAMGRPGSWSDK